jgi:hypothetical protein
MARAQPGQVVWCGTVSVQASAYKLTVQPQHSEWLASILLIAIFDPLQVAN